MESYVEPYTHADVQKIISEIYDIESMKILVDPKLVYQPTFDPNELEIQFLVQDRAHCPAFRWEVLAERLPPEHQNDQFRRKLISSIIHHMLDRQERCSKSMLLARWLFWRRHPEDCPATECGPVILRELVHSFANTSEWTPESFIAIARAVSLSEQETPSLLTVLTELRHVHGVDVGERFETQQIVKIFKTFAHESFEALRAKTDVPKARITDIIDSYCDLARELARVAVELEVPPKDLLGYPAQQMLLRHTEGNLLKGYRGFISATPHAGILGFFELISWIEADWLKNEYQEFVRETIKSSLLKGDVCNARVTYAIICGTFEETAKNWTHFSLLMGVQQFPRFEALLANAATVAEKQLGRYAVAAYLALEAGKVSEFQRLSLLASEHAQRFEPSEKCRPVTW